MSELTRTRINAPAAPVLAPRRRFGRLRAAPFTALLFLVGGLVGLLILLTPIYLLLRTAGAGREAVDILTRARTLSTLWNTVSLAAAVTAASAAIAVPLAWLTARTDLPGRKIWALAAALPLVIPSYVVAYLYASLLTPKGQLQQWLEPWLGIERLPEFYGFRGAFLVLTLASYPYIFLTVRAALSRMDPALLEAARTLGHSGRAAFRRVTLPYLKPSIAAGALLVALYTLRDFGAVTLLQYSTFTRVIYNRYLSYRLDMAAALAVVLILLTGVILYLEYRSRGRARYARLSVGVARQPAVVRLGRWKWVALLFVAAVVFLALVVPVGGLAYWFWRGWRQDFLVQAIGPAGSNVENLLTLLQPAWNSLSASLLAALLTMIAALPIAILAVRKQNRFSQLLERLTYAGFALPGIVVALAFVFFGANYAPALYQSLPMLLLAYMVLFIPQAVGTERASLLQVSPSMEEAGRSLGHSPWRVFRRITLPLVRSGMVAGAALVFLTAMKELPATLILSPLGFDSLAVQVWANIGEAFFARAAAPTLLLVLLSSVPLALLNARSRS